MLPAFGFIILFHFLFLLSQNIEKAIIRPTAFKPVVPKSRSNMHYLSPRPGDALSNSQGNLNLLAPCPSELAPSAGSSERRSSYSGSRNGLMSQSCSFSLSDSGRNSLSSLPTCNSGGGGVAYSPGQSDVSGHPMSDPVKLTSMAPPPPPPPPISHGHTSSDSGRSSSSKSTGSLTGMGVRGGGGGGVGVPLSDCGSCGRSPSQAEAYEHMVRDLEEKLRERDLELHDLRDNLDENEVAICQVRLQHHLDPRHINPSEVSLSSLPPSLSSLSLSSLPLSLLSQTPPPPRPTPYQCI